MRRGVVFCGYLLLLTLALISSAEKTNKILVKLKPEVSIREVQATHPLVKFERSSTLPNVFVFSVANIDDVEYVSLTFNIFQSSVGLPT